MRIRATNAQRVDRSPAQASLRDAIAATEVTASTGLISFNALGEVQKSVQVQIVKDGEWRHHSVIDDTKLLAPPTE